MVGLIIIVVVLLYLTIASAVITKVEGRRKKLIAFAVFLLIPLADMIVGQLYFRYLCSTYSGQFVYKTVELSDEYILKPGEIDKYGRGSAPGGYATAKGGEINRVKLRDRYDLSLFERDTYSRLLNITRIRSGIRDKTSGRLLSEAVSFNHRWGWIFNIYPHGPITYCSDVQKPTAKANFYNTFEKTFVTKSNKQ